MIRYTFVIPHYNIPTLLERCIKSIPERNDIQIVVVDDGSELKPTITRIDVELTLLPEHTNSGNARNVGLSKAKGKWILFPDADDFYNPGFIDELDKYAESDNQVVFFSMNSCDSETLKPSTQNIAINQYVEGAANGDKNATNNLLYLRGNVSNMMISHTYIKKYDFKFESSVINNDVLFHLNSCYHLKHYSIITRQLYCYTYRVGSIQHSKLSLEAYYEHFCNTIKRYEYFDYRCQKRPQPLLLALFIGHDNPLKKKTRLQRHINRSIYFVKTLFIVITRFKEIYDSRMFYVDEIKRSTAYAEQHS